VGPFPLHAWDHRFVPLRTVPDNVVPQEIRFCRASDGVGIAYARHGSGPPLVIATCWLSHLQYDWQSPVWRHFLDALGSFAEVVRYDERGHGLSDWEVEDFGLEARIADLEAVVDSAGLDRFALMGMAQGGPVAIAYAVRHPERVSRLLFYGGFAAARRVSNLQEDELGLTFEQMIKVGWGRPDAVFRRVFTSLMIPAATEEQMRWLDELQRMAVTPENAADSLRERRRADVTHLLPELNVPTLVLHARGDRISDFAKGRVLAAGIVGSRLVALDSDNHILLEDEPAWPVFLREVEQFVSADREPSPDRPAAPTSSAHLSARELDVLRLAARGQDNDTIAHEMTISVRTVERHLHNVYAKLELHGKSARTAAVAWLLTRS
jgi:pimeloyl-ACP methyl ester carboxylesterase/DNA-binding CsgD family transcriptional regulator